MNLKGKYVVVEGPDGAGKTLLVETLYRFLLGNGLRIHKTREPGGTYTGSKIREILKDSEMQRETPALARRMLFEADRIIQQAAVRKSLSEGCFVLQDRCALVSNAAYGAAEGTDPYILQRLESLDPDRLLPDLVIFLTAPYDVLRSRCKPDGTDPAETNESLFNQVQSRYEEMRLNARPSHVVPWSWVFIGEWSLPAVFVWSDQPIEGVVKDCVEALEKAFE